MMKDSPTSASTQSIRARAATLALLTTFVLTALKLGATWITGSVGLFSESIHSSLDLVSALVAFFTIREAGKPADEEHPFGHGKIETLSSLFEAVLLVGAAAFIFHEAWGAFREPQEVSQPLIGIGAIVISLVLSAVVYFHNREAAKKTESRAIEVNALHFLADTVTSVGVLLSLVVIHFTGWTWVDPAMAMLVGVYILSVSWGQIVGSTRELVDRRLPDEENARVIEVLEGFKDRILGVHDLRTRKSGVERHIEFHLSLCGTMSVKESHQLCDEIEEKIGTLFPGASVWIHVEPCGTHEDSVEMNWVVKSTKSCGCSAMAAGKD